MSVTVTTPAENTRLVLLEDVKRELEIELDDNEYDLALDRIILDVSDAIVEHCQRPFARQTYQEKATGTGDTILQLSRIPVISVSSILRESAAFTDYEIYDAETGQLYSRSGWIAEDTVFGWLTEHRVNRGLSKWYIVNYVAGYTLPGTEDFTLPRNVSRAALETVKYWFSKMDAGNDPTVTSKKVGDLALTYDPSMATEFGGVAPLAVPLLRNYMDRF